MEINPTVKENTNLNAAPKLAVESLFVKSSMEINTPSVKGYDFNKGIDYSELIRSYLTTGFQATCLGQSIDIINKMLNWRLSDEPIEETEDSHFKDPEVRKNTKCTIFLGYTSNLISSGMRDIFRFLVQHKLVDCIVTTCGGIEEDFIKCLANTYLGDFHLNDIELRKSGVNRIANLIIPNDNYCKFEDWVLPIFEEMHKEQDEKGTIFTPSKIIKRLGEKINNPDSVYYWAAKNNIPVFCPAINDGSLGDMMFFHSYTKKGFIVDLVKDTRKMDKTALKAKKSGVIILGGGIVKHHILNANLMRNGADFAVFVNTGNEWDGSDAGARPHEALSWGKLKIGSQFCKIWCDATLVFPIIVAETFAKYYHENVKEKEARLLREEANDAENSTKKESSEI